MKTAIASAIAAVLAIVTGVLDVAGVVLGTASNVLDHSEKAVQGLGDTVKSGLKRAQEALR